MTSHRFRWMCFVAALVVCVTFSQVGSAQSEASGLRIETTISAH
jgi:hypothetical protein